MYGSSINRPWSPFEELKLMQKALRPEAETTEIERPRMELDVFEKNGYVVLKASMPGVKKEDIRLNVDGDMLRISAEWRQDHEVEEDDYYLRERRHGKVSRAMRLPRSLDLRSAKVNFADGELTMEIPRKEEASASYELPLG